MAALFKVLCALGSSWAAAGSLCAAVPDFPTQVRPILAEHCFECHGPDQSKAGLNLTSFSTATRELKSGAVAVVPGKPEASELLRRIQATDPDDRMPPRDKERLSPAEMDILTRWVAAGGQYTGHWAYQPVRSPPLPPVRDTGWPRTPIDHFILAKLEAAGVHPSPEADRYTLLRRLYYDLLGLPPTPDEADQFASDPAPDAFERMVERLLENPHFGERWGRHWLDAARYADSDGYEKDRPRPDAWRYRDWVIDAFNRNMPFDQFTVEQIAGDLLPEATPDQIVATAFHRQTLTNDEGGVDKEQYRLEAVFDRVETVGNVWLGLTVGCARCHSHKYDQLSHREYYQLLAFFNNADEVTAKVPSSSAAWLEYQHQHGFEVGRLISWQRRLDQARARFATRLPNWEKEVQARLAKAKDKTATFHWLAIQSVQSSGKARFEPMEDGSWLAVEPSEAGEVITLNTVEWSQPITALQIEFLDDANLPCQGPGRGDNGVLALSEIKAGIAGASAGIHGLKFHTPKATAEAKGFPVRNLIDGDDQTAWVVRDKVGEWHAVTLHLARPLAPGQSLWIRIESKVAKVHGGPGRLRLAASSDETVESILPETIRETLAEEPVRRPLLEVEALVHWAAQWDEEVEALTADLECLQQRFPKAPLMDVRVVAERQEARRATRILKRGDFLNPSDEVAPGTPAILASLRPRTSRPDRLDLARWLVSEDNPLAPRVAVNQVWLRLFGEGLVRTPNDFGVRGEPPTHPQLLDWLAHDFVAGGWNYKALIRRLVTSATYRQSAEHRPEMEDVDPQNRLWHRQNRWRVEAEIVRDISLAASGLLTARIGGPSVFPPMPEDVAALSYANNFRWKASAGEDRYRRGLYTFFKRTAPHPDLVAFDCPDANLAVLRRHTSNTPIQALTTLNGEAFAEAAKALAARVLDEASPDVDTRLTRAFRLCVGRPPSASEIACLRRLLENALIYYRQQGDQAVELVARFTQDQSRAPELAAWTATTRILLNLDETITRN